MSYSERMAKSQDDSFGVEKKPRNLFFLYSLISLSCIGGFLFGYDTGIISGALVLISDDFDLESWEEELVVSTTVFGAMISSMGSGPLCDKYGRKPIVLASAFVFIVGALQMAFAPSFTSLVIGRFIVGLGVGSASMNMPIIISEMAETDIRGMLVTCINVAITGGQFISCLVAGALSTTKYGWRYMLGLAAIPAAIQLIGFLFMPESPRWLIENDHVELATLVLQSIRGKDDVYAELEEIVAAIESERGVLKNSALGGVYTEDRAGEQAGFLQTLRTHLSRVPIRRALFIGCCLQAGQQLGGINTVMYYSATILKLAGFTSNSQAIWLSSVVAFCNFFGSCVGLYFVDRIGRRPLTLLSMSATVLLLAALSLCFYYAQHTSETLDKWVYNNPYGIPDDDCSDYKYCFDCVQDDHCGYCSDVNSPSVHSGSHNGCLHTRYEHSGAKNETVCKDSNFYAESCPGSAFAGWMIFMFLCVYLLGFAPGMGPMPWCVNSEIYPTAFRGVGNSISTSVNWSTNILMSMTFLTLINFTSKQGAFMIYAAISMVFLAIYAIYLPETKARPLETIKLSFMDGRWGRMLCRPSDEEYSVIETDGGHDGTGNPDRDPIDDSLAGDILGPLLAYRGKSGRVIVPSSEISQSHTSSSSDPMHGEDSTSGGSLGGELSPERSGTYRPSITTL